MTVPMDKWQRAQELEADYHRNDKWRKSPAFMEDTGKLFEWMGFERGQYADTAIVDVGCGSVLRTDWFDGVYIHGIEPMMAAHFLDTLYVGKTYYPYAAEVRLTALEDVPASAVFCINVLDHCYDPRKVVENCIAYLAPGGTLCLSTDISDSPDEMHPAVFTEADVESWLVGVTVERKLRGLPDSKAYGRGEAVTWICRK